MVGRWGPADILDLVLNRDTRDFRLPPGTQDLAEVLAIPDIQVQDILGIRGIQDIQGIQGNRGTLGTVVKAGIQVTAAPRILRRTRNRTIINSFWGTTVNRFSTIRLLRIPTLFHPTELLRIR